MADELKIVVKALLDEKDLLARAAAIEGVTIHGKIVIDKADLNKQIDGIVGESTKFGNKFKIKYGVDKGDFVKQFRVAGEEAKNVVEKALAGAGAGAGVNIPLNINPDAVKTLKNELKKLDFDDDSIASATKELEGMNITVGKIKKGYESIADAQAGLKTLTISGIDKQGNQDVTIIQKYNAESKELLKTQIQVTAKYNEMGEAATRVATTMRGTGGEAANQVFTEKLNRLISDLKTSGVYTDEMKQKTDELAVSLKGAFDQSSIDAVNDQYRVLIERAKTLKQEASVVASSPVTRIDTNTAKLSTSLSYQGMDAQTAGISNLRNEINSLIGEYGRLKASMDGVDPNSAEFQALGVQVDALDSRFKSATKAAELFNGTFSNNNKLEGVADQIERAKTKLAEMEVRWSKFKGNPQLLAEFDALRASAEKLDAIGMPNFTKQMQAFESHVRAAGADTRSFGDELKNALAKFGLWITASSIFMQVWRGMRQMVDSVKELDSALVEFNKVADLSSSQLDKFIDRAFEAGEALGRTGTEVIQATAIFKQAGYSVEESLNLANSALVMKNVSENIESTAAAASDLIAVMKGFDMAVSDSMSIVDMINNVSNNLPIAFGSVSEGLTRVSGTLAQTGTTIQETIGLITGGFASLRNVEKVSSGLIQISQR